MKVEQVDFITIPSRDVKRSVEFYRDVLGIPESEYEGAEIETPNVTLSFWNPEQEGIEFQPNGAGFGVRVADVDTKVCHMGFFKDPDGNVVVLHRRYAPRVPR